MPQLLESWPGHQQHFRPPAWVVQAPGRPLICHC